MIPNAGADTNVQWQGGCCFRVCADANVDANVDACVVVVLVTDAKTFM